MEEDNKERVQVYHDNVQGSSEHHVRRESSGARSETKPQVKKEGNDNFWKVTTVVAILLLAFFAFRGNDAPSAPTGAPTVAPLPQPNAPAPSLNPSELKALEDDDAVKGDPNAPVTIIEFSDFECPFCARFYTETLGQIDEQYIKTGKVKLIYRDFPLSFHPNAQKAAEAAECAGEEGKYWEMHDLLFEKGVVGGVTTFKGYAKEIGLDQADFDSCLDSGKMVEEIQSDMSEGSLAGITGTPGFLVNGKIVSGAQPFSVFKQIIESELN